MGDRCRTCTDPAGPSGYCETCREAHEPGLSYGFPGTDVVDPGGTTWTVGAWRTPSGDERYCHLIGRGTGVVSLVPWSVVASWRGAS